MIYLDHAATTPIAKEVLEKMYPYFSEHFANPSSQIHPAGRTAKAAIDKSLKSLATSFGVDESELMWTSGATQSCNWAIRGVWKHYSIKRKKIMLSTIEHSAVIETAKYLEREEGAELIWIPVTEDGEVDIDFIAQHINEKVLLIAVMAANNLTGVKQDLKKIGELAKENEVFFFCDATQLIATEDIKPKDLGIDLMAMSAHKFYGPKGIGLLYASRRNPRVNLPNWEYGGGMEIWKKGGTLDTPSIVGMAEALNWVRKQDWERVKVMRDELEDHLKSLGAVILGEKVDRIVNASNISFPGISNKRILQDLQQEIAFSLASACSSQNPGPSHVLTAMRLDEKTINGSFRLSWGLGNSREELEKVKQLFTMQIEKLKN